MKDVKIAELKSHLSRYIRAASRGERTVVLDRSTPVAEIGPPPHAFATGWERRAQQGAVQLGTQDWATLRISPLRKKINAQALLDAVRDES